MAFLDKVLGKDETERKLEKEIQSLELRKESVFSAINTEIARLQRERTNVLLNAGIKAYEVFSQENKQADLTEFWNQIAELDKQVSEQEDKRTEMGIKYDEEIRLINSSIGTRAINNTASAGSSSQCPTCGSAITNNDVFCQSCGAKLQ